MHYIFAVKIILYKMFAIHQLTRLVRIGSDDNDLLGKHFW